MEGSLGVVVSGEDVRVTKGLKGRLTGLTGLLRVMPGELGLELSIGAPLVDGELDWLCDVRRGVRNGFVRTAELV